MRTHSVGYGIVLFLLGIVTGWWLADRPLNQLDDAIRIRLSEFGNVTIPIGVLILVIILIVLMASKR